MLSFLFDSVINTYNQDQKESCVEVAFCIANEFQAENIRIDFFSEKYAQTFLLVYNSIQNILFKLTESFQSCLS